MKADGVKIQYQYLVMCPNAVLLIVYETLWIYVVVI